MTSFKQVPGDFALLGGAPRFEEPIPVGQLYFPAWERYEAAMRAIFDRGWYTNHGPLAQELEDRLSQFYGVKHVVTVTNATIGLLMTAKALGLRGKVVVPSFSFVASAQALTWAGLEVVFCDVDPHTHQVTPEHVGAVLDEDVTGILGVNLWGGCCDPAAMERFALQEDLTLFFDSAHGSGVTVAGRPLGGFGSAEVFSFHATKALSATEGGCVCTNDDALAARLRNIRSSYGAGRPVEVPVTSNGRFSEAQAAIALMSLEDFPSNRSNNEHLFRTYEEGLAGTPGVRVIAPAGVDQSNYQYVVVEVDEDEFGLHRDELLRVLHGENVVARRYFHPGIHRTTPYCDDQGGASRVLPHTDRLSARLLQLPIGALVMPGATAAIAELIAAVQTHAQALTSRVGA
ncbi:MAG: Pyridoxal phosphate-dependent enzyme apparently involved in regulation of cell wall biosis [Acidimicrobiaceae bacterium]|nr:Pyridoxal phosphate-dependent enzyme apparently involved in regulation of cell wall biosis [Acidimicrobiaceae bacterium]